MKMSIHTPHAPAPIGAYSQAIVHEHTMYISGQIPITPKTGELLDKSFKNQIRQVFTNLSEIAKASGTSLHNALKLTIYLTELNNFTEVNDIMEEFFTPPYPARAVVEVKALPKHAPIEIEAILAVNSHE